MSKFYTFRQNNSGGFYLFDAREVIVEADSLSEAEEIAYRETDVYEGLGPHDCECCGGRWWHPWEGSEESSVGVKSWAEARENGIVIVRK